MEPRQIRFNETIEEAIADDVASLGGPKAAASMFFPDRTPEQGAYLLRSWANEVKAERPSPSQLILLIEQARTKIGFSAVARYMEQRLNCRIEFLSVDDERERLQRQYVDAVAQLRNLADRLEKNEGRS